ncbi:MAG: branched-chain amino acid ABC transporter permease [Clostridiales bacterium]|nr:branched-chain amino acid ABC transporter permease [Clostridiales bacterium]
MEKNQNTLSGFFRNNRATVIGVLILACAAAYMLQTRYLSMVLDFICIYTIAVTGLDLLFGYTGQVSFGQAGFYAIGAYTSALLSKNMGIPAIVTIFLGAILAMIFGIIVAFPASRLVKHFLSLLTIAFGQMVYTFVNSNSMTGGPSGIGSIPKISIFGFTLSGYQRYFWLVLVLVIATIIMKNNIINSRIGRAFIAVRENPAAAAGMGINVAKYKIMAFAISAFLAGLAGALYTHLVGFISPDTFTKDQSNMFMTMLLFGGIATIVGPMIGATAILAMQELLQQFAAYQTLIYAVLILIVLFLLPNGTVGLYTNVRAAIAKRFRKAREGDEHV